MGTPSKKIPSKSFEKPLDKSLEVWYNIYIKEREVHTMYMIKRMKNRVIRDHGFESGITRSFFYACEEYRDGLLSWKELKSIYMRAIGG